MTIESDPPRLLESGDAPERVKQLLQSCREDVGSAAQITELESRLAPILWQPGPISGPVGGTGAAGMTALKLGALVVVAAATAGSFWIGTKNEKAPARPPLITSPAAPARPRLTANAPAPAVAPAPPPADSTIQKLQSANPKPAASAETPSESDLLTQAQAALGRDPAKALSLTDQHRRLFAHGVLSQEREVIAIEALARLGRTADVKARAARFLTTYPDSAHRSKIQSLTGSE